MPHTNRLLSVCLLIYQQSSVTKNTAGLTEATGVIEGRGRGGEGGWGHFPTCLWVKTREGEEIMPIPPPPAVLAHFSPVTHLELSPVEFKRRGGIKNVGEGAAEGASEASVDN